MSVELVRETQLPRDDGSVPAGRWRCVLRDYTNDHLASAIFRGGLMENDVCGRDILRIVAHIPTIGAMRVSGGSPCELGDCSRLKPAAVEIAGVEVESDVAGTGELVSVGSFVEAPGAVDVPSAADEAALMAELEAEEAASEAAKASTPDAAPEGAGESSPGAAPTSTKDKGKRK